MESRILSAHRPWLVIAGVAGLLVTGVVPGIDVALERLLQIMSAGVAIAALLPARSANHWYLRMARAARRDARRSLHQLLARAGDPEPADISFRRPSAETEPTLVQWGADGCEGTIGQLPSIVQAHRSHRLVVCGEGGAGKTTTGHLLTDLLNGFLLAGDAGRAFAQRVKVVIFLSMAGWTRSAEWLRDAKPDEVADALDSWLARQLVEQHRTPWHIAQRLIREGLVMPVLVGVDEMDPPDSPGRPRAAAVIRAVNYSERPVVLLCRTADYRQVASGDSRNGEPPVVQDALHVILKDLTPERIHDYLVRRFSDRSGGLQSRWRPVAEALRSDSDRHEPGLARILSRPWQLFLAITTYLDPQTDPTELLRTPPERLNEFLMARFVEAAASRNARLGRYHRRHGGRGLFDVLSTLACHLRTTGDPDGRFKWSPTDLYLDDVWPIGGWYAPRYLAFVVKAVMAAVPGGFALVVGGRQGLLSIPLVILLISTTALAVALAFVIERHPDPRPLERSDVRAHDRRRWFFDRQLGGAAGGLINGVMIAGASALAIGLMQGPGSQVAAGLLVGLAGGLASAGVWHVSGVRTVSRPSSLLRKSIASELATTVTPWLILFTGVTIWLVVTDGWPMVPALAAIGIAGAGGLVFGSLTFLVATRWLRYWIAVAIAASRGDLPWRLAALLDDAYETGLMRLSGIAVQFRHQELQKWLVAWREREASGRGHTVEAAAPGR